MDAQVVVGDEDEDVRNIFKALSDPVRWSILKQIAEVAELPCSVLEDTLEVAKPTISYHVRTLQQANLILSRKRGRRYFYVLNREAVDRAMTGLWQLSPTPAAVRDDGTTVARPAKRRSAPHVAEPVATGEATVRVMTW